MFRTNFNTVRDMLRYFLTDSLFELPMRWENYMDNGYPTTKVKRYSPQGIKRQVKFGFDKFKFTERRGAYLYHSKEDNKKYSHVCPLPEGMSTYGYNYDLWSETHGYIELGEHCLWDESKDNYLAYNIKDHDVNFYLNKYFNDFYILNELSFYAYLKEIDPSLDHNEVYNVYRNSFTYYTEGFTYKDKELDFDHVFSVYVEQMNINQQKELEELNRQIAELETKRNKCFKNYE